MYITRLQHRELFIGETRLELAAQRQANLKCGSYRQPGLSTRIPHDGWCTMAGSCTASWTDPCSYPEYPPRRRADSRSASRNPPVGIRQLGSASRDLPVGMRQSGSTESGSHRVGIRLDSTRWRSREAGPRETARDLVGRGRIRKLGSAGHQLGTHSLILTHLTGWDGMVG